MSYDSLEVCGSVCISLCLCFLIFTFPVFGTFLGITQWAVVCSVCHGFISSYWSVHLFDQGWGWITHKHRESREQNSRLNEACTLATFTLKSCAKMWAWNNQRIALISLIHCFVLTCSLPSLFFHSLAHSTTADLSLSVSLIFKLWIIFLPTEVTNPLQSAFKYVGIDGSVCKNSQFIKYWLVVVVWVICHPKASAPKSTYLQIGLLEKENIIAISSSEQSAESVVN